VDKAMTGGLVNRSSKGFEIKDDEVQRNDNYQNLELESAGASLDGGALKAPPTGATKLPKMMSGYPEGDEHQSLVDATAELYINLVRWAYEGEVVLITNEGDKGVNLNQPATLHFLSDEEEHEFVVTPLQAAALGDSDLVVLELLSYEGVEPDARNHDDNLWTALFYATDFGNLNAMRALLSHPSKRANADLQDVNKDTCLHLAVRNEYCMIWEHVAQMVQLLASHGANLNTRNLKGFTPLLELADSVSANSSEVSGVGVVEALLANKDPESSKPVVNLNSKAERDKRTAAHIAVDHDNLQLFKTLINNGANLYAKNALKQMVLTKALQKAEFAQWLLSRPTLLRSVSMILALILFFKEQAKEQPAFGPDFRALADQATTLVLSLLDLCNTEKAHYLIMGTTKKSYYDAKETALDTAMFVNCKAFLAHRTVHREMQQVWVAKVWDSKRKSFINSSIWKSPRNSMTVFNLFYMTYLALWVYHVITKRSEVDNPQFETPEVLVYVYATGFALKEISSFSRLGLEYFFDNWNVVDSSIVVWHLVAFVLRTTERSFPGFMRGYKQDVYTCLISLNLVISFARLLWMFNFSPTLGPLQLMITRMVSDVFRFFVLFMVLYLAFVVGSYQLFLKYDIDEMNTLSKCAWLLWRSTLGDPDTQWLESIDSDLISGFGKVGYSVYLFVSTVMLINLLIAMMSSTYEKIQVNVDEEWKAEWAVMVKYLSEEQSLLEVTPPLNLLMIPLHLTYRFKYQATKLKAKVLSRNRVSTIPQEPCTVAGKDASATVGVVGGEVVMGGETISKQISGDNEAIVLEGADKQGALAVLTAKGKKQFHRRAKDKEEYRAQVTRTRGSMFAFDPKHEDMETDAQIVEKTQLFFTEVAEAWESKQDKQDKDQDERRYMKMFTVLRHLERQLQTVQDGMKPLSTVPSMNHHNDHPVSKHPGLNGTISRTRLVPSGLGATVAVGVGSAGQQVHFEAGGSSRPQSLSQEFQATRMDGGQHISNDHEMTSATGLGGGVKVPTAYKPTAGTPHSARSKQKKGFRPPFKTK